MKGLVFDTENQMQFKDFGEPLLDNQKRTRRTQYNRDGWFSVRLVLFPTENKKVSKKDPNLA